MAAGGNFIDTSINYTNGTSERFVGEFIASGRERLVVATKYSLSTRKDDPNAGGNQRKNLTQSLDTSLRRLGTDYIDLFWLHMWDYLTPVEEVMRGLDDAVQAGKILYAGVSDTPAWVVAQANTLAALRGWTPFVALQLPYSLADRDPERDLLPMARSFQLAVTAWVVLGGGVLTGKYNGAGSEPRRYDSASENSRRLAEVVMQIAAESGRSAAQVAINWVRQQEHGAIIPILGARSEAQLVDNLAALEFSLTDEQLQRLERASPIDLGFPHTFLTSNSVRELIFGDTFDLIDAHRG